MKVIPGEEEVAIDAIPLASKSPTIVDWKIHKEGKKSYYQIVRADGKSQMYLVFSHMLKSFDREDLEDLYKLVKARYGSTRLVEDLDLVLWNDLKNMFEPHVEDEIWKLQQRYKVLSWKLFDSCGVHCLSLQSGMIYMLVEKRYPLTPPTIIDMLNKKLQVNYFSEILNIKFRGGLLGLKVFLMLFGVTSALIDVNAVKLKEFDLLKWDQHSSFELSVRPSYKRCRSPAAIVTSSIHATRALVPSHIEAVAMADKVAVDRDVEAGVDAGIGMMVNVGVDVEGEVEDEVESSDRGTMEVGVDVVVGIDIPDGMLMPDAVEHLEQRELEARSLIDGGERASLLEQVASLERETSSITRSGMTSEAIEEIINRRVEESLAAYEVTRAANALEAESQSQNGSDDNNGNGGNRNGGDGNGGNGNGENGNPNENNR
ncbi:hypothetical protein Tco_1482065 [Tanacetum coccineum]